MKFLFHFTTIYVFEFVNVYRQKIFVVVAIHQIYSNIYHQEEEREKEEEEEENNNFVCHAIYAIRKPFDRRYDETR